MDQPAYSTENRELLKLKYYSDLNRTSVFLFVGLIALMALLLTAGFQKPHRDLSVYMFGSIMSLGLNVLIYPLGRYIHLQLSGKSAPQDRLTSALRLAQLVLFVISIICLMGLALSVSQFFFKAPGA
jgi:hypothetical protein